MFARIVLALSLAGTLATAGAARAQTRPAPVRVDAGPLARSLQEIARQTGSELLFDHGLVADLRAPRVEGRLTPIAAVEAALASAKLAGSQLIVRRSASGALIVEAAAAPPLAQQDVAVAEVLVIGRRTQNADIPRRETDIQPYRVFTGEEIVAAHVDTLGEYFDERVTTNTGVPTGSGLETGSASSIDLRGLGQSQTLVLVDGRRMPGFPIQQIDFLQPDINALPLHAIDRVEVLTGTASGIYGFGALGGVVNVVLAHDRPGAQAYLTTGISSRGDAGRVAFEGRVEFSPDHGDTEVALDVAVSHEQALKVGQRDFDLRNTLAAYRADPTTVPIGNSITITNLFGDEPLSFKPEFGGATLTSSHTLLPTGFEGTQQALVAALTSHAGQLDFSTPSATAASDLTATPTMGSLLLNVRHRFAGGVEAYFDGIMLWNHTRYVGHGGSTLALLTPDEPTDPFEQYVFAYFPTPLTTTRSETDYDNSRLTAGLLAPLAHDWRATAEVTWGEARVKQSALDQFFFGAPDDANPLGSWSAFQAAMAPTLQSSGLRFVARDLYSEVSLRLAGPVLRLPGGAATVTLLAEHRREASPAYPDTAFDAGNATTVEQPPHSTTTTSLYAELRAPVFADAAPSPLLHQLELQAAIRAERETDDFSDQSLGPSFSPAHAAFNGVFYTAGAKVSPTPWLTVRASYATGETPPPLQDLTTLVDTSAFPLDDPQRGGFGGGSDGPYTEKSGGSHDLKSVRAATVSVGVVLTPFGPGGLRASLDYSRIRRTNDVLTLDTDTVLAHEDFWPQRVQRAPLTAEDAALGYTAGPITLIDTTAMNAASYTSQTLDAHVDWPIVLPLGRLRLYGAATYAFDGTRRQLFQPDLQFAGSDGGPLTWRANAGADWTIGATTLGANVRYYSAYSVENPLGPDFANAVVIAAQGADHIPAQAYLDLRVSRRFALRGAGRVLQVDLGLSNVLDTVPPQVVAVAGGLGGISPYGDPRRRRVELTLSAGF